MLQYLIVLLDAAATPFCHDGAAEHPAQPMPEATLRQAIRYAMLQNLMVQFVYPVSPVPSYVDQLVETIDHAKIKPLGAPGAADVVVLNGWADLAVCPQQAEATYVWRTDLDTFCEHAADLARVAVRVGRMNIALTDVEAFTDADVPRYAAALDVVAAALVPAYVAGQAPQFSLLTDRLALQGMNNCDAGWRHLTLAPDGCFYVCPAFYRHGAECAVGSLPGEPSVSCAELYQLDHAPICSHCDAWQCRRCVWLSAQLTLEANTPSHQQCVVAHVERGAACRLAAALTQAGISLPEADLQGLKETECLDPFELRTSWQK